MTRRRIALAQRQLERWRAALASAEPEPSTRPGVLREDDATRAEADASAEHRADERREHARDQFDAPTNAEGESSRDRDADSHRDTDTETDTDADTDTGAEAVSDTGRRDYAPVGHPERTGGVATVRRVVSEFRENSLTDEAATLTYYGLLALFPGLIALVSVLGLLGDPDTTTRTLTDVIDRLAPGSASETLRDPIESITENRGRAGLAFAFGLAAALWSASGYIGAFMRAANVIYETPEGRPFWKLRPLQLLVTLVIVLLLVALLTAVVLTGPVVDAVAGPLGIGDQAVDVWNIAKWPVMLLVALLMLAILFYASPNVRIPRFSLITPGAVLAIALWLLTSVLFAFYVANFGSYDKTYGTLGGVISLLVWLWISNIALLLGLQLNAEIERGRELDAGVSDAAREIQLDAREEPSRRKTT